MMSWLQSLSLVPPPPDARPMREVEQDILDELEFHIEMRTLDNVSAGMSADKARQNAVERFGDFERIRKTCRRTLLGERIMLQRIQAVLTAVLLGAVVYLGVSFYQWQQAQEAVTARVLETLQNNRSDDKATNTRLLVALEQVAQRSETAVAALGPPRVVQTVPKSGSRDVDPLLTEIRVTYDKEMMDHSWSWCGNPAHGYPKTTGDPHYEADGKTCVLPVKLEPGGVYTILLNSESYQNFKDASGQPAVPYVLQFATRQEGAADGGPKQRQSGPPPAERPQAVSEQDEEQSPPKLEFPPEDLAYVAAGADEDAKALITRVLEANRPWLEPKPVKASYSLVRTPSAEAREAEAKSRELGPLREDGNGPFSITDGCKPAVRVGSIVWTPLHSMARKDSQYTVHMVGKGEWKGMDFVAVDSAFDPPVREGVGFGGQGNVNYSNSNSMTAKARLMIEPTEAVPLFIESWTDVLPGIGARFRSTWVFDPDFFEVDGGFAPKMFEWESVDAFRERQEFQLVSGVWIFKQGDAWHGAKNPFGESGHIQKMELVDLQIAEEK